MLKKYLEIKGYRSIRKGIHGAVGVLALGLLFFTTDVVSADEVSAIALSTVSSEQDINGFERQDFSVDNGAEVSTITESVGNEVTPVVENMTSISYTSLQDRKTCSN